MSSVGTAIHRHESYERVSQVIEAEIFMTPLKRILTSEGMMAMVTGGILHFKKILTQYTLCSSHSEKRGRKKGRQIKIYKGAIKFHQSG